MYNFNPAQWILINSRIKFDDDFVVEGIPFQLMSLSEDNIEAVRLLKTSKDIIELAANGGFAIDRKRAIEDESLVSSLAQMWEQDAVLAFNDPTIIFSVGERVCELSGLVSFLDEVLAHEENEEKELAALLLEDESRPVDGDNLDVDKITADANEYILNQTVA
ncbi:MAG: hypothetical protein Unbinned5350contig1004_47 [Prokaryotic dsDNA virus sp.]|nr:MAG: hypothetical protein Unbinned5350contig1004_47 [Prokaryotic dsDNA virus sp.]|tara:strand:+ start:2136 stop:2624 length:489 start_codon:yes stop_codon:yes gene_type:complete